MLVSNSFILSCKTFICSCGVSCGACGSDSVCCFLFFGKESKGLPEEFLEEHRQETVRIPMLPGIRSLNLSNSVAVTVYEALRQLDFPGLQNHGKMRENSPT